VNKISNKNLNVSFELKELFTADQSDRSSDHGHCIDLTKMIANDKIRLVRAHEIERIFKNNIADLSADDLYHLAMLFQHSPDIEDYKITIELATLSGQKGNIHGKWLSAAAEDRYLVSAGQKQKWGTQFRKDENGPWQLQPMETDQESGITDIMRKEKGVTERSKQLETFLKLRQLRHQNLSRL